MKGLWNSLERKMQMRNYFSLLGNLKKTVKRQVQASTSFISQTKLLATDVYSHLL